MFRHRTVILALAATLVTVGCAPKTRPTRTTQPTSANEAMQVSELRRRSKELSEVANQLPGKASDEDRRLVAEALARAGSVLELLGGPNPDGAFRQQLRIIDNTRNFLNSDGETSSGPATDSGLRSLANALSHVRERMFADDNKVQDQLDMFRQRIFELDAVHGPMHSLVVAQAFTAASAVVDTMANELDARAAGEAQPASVSQPAGK